MKPKDAKEASQILLKDREQREKLFMERLELLKKEFNCTLSVQVTLEQKGDVILLNKRLIVTASP